MHSIFFQSVNSIIPMKESSDKALKRLGIFCIRDLLFYKPHTYLIKDVSPNLSLPKIGSLIQTEITINEISLPTSRNSPIKIYASNQTGGILLVFFNKIPTFIYNRLKIGAKCIISGKVQYFDGMYQITHPEFILKKSLSVPVEPVYHLTYGIINKQLYDYILMAIKAVELSINTKILFGKNDISKEDDDYVISLIQEIKNLHLVDHTSDHILIDRTWKETISKLAFKELLANQFALLKLKEKEKQQIGLSLQLFPNVQSEVLNKLGFELTESQKKAIQEIEANQISNTQMMRLMQGDVGSGKTIVALMTMINATKSKVQAALMAPTDLLSIQHYQFFIKVLDQSEIKVELLTGKTSVKERNRIKNQLEAGEIDILIGTHALFQKGISFKDLGYIVIDEQHRFGVEQRMELIAKASRPDVLVMTATPIPRSLTLTMFGDMDITLLKDKPKNRLPIITVIKSTDNRLNVIDSLKRRLDLDEKIYWVCPLIDQNDNEISNDDKFQYSDVSSTFLELEKKYVNKVGILHGKMKSSEKDSVMQRFKDGEIKILVATTVIEVGIDVPEASLIIIENAEKFGLAQLHQLRGRVGRGNLQSYCILMYNPRLSNFAKQRLEIMRASNDGFYIAEKDLVLRGGGEILGTKQSGEPEFFFADLKEDTEILLQANKLASASNIPQFQVRLFAKDRENFVKSG